MNPALAELRDLHLPDPVSWWPPAMGWWLLLGLLLSLVVISLLAYRYWKKHKRYRRQALQTLKVLYRTQNDTAFLHGTAELLKHTALQKDPATAKLSGEQWQQYLQAFMPQESAQLIAVARYQPQPQINKEAVYQAAMQWIRTHR